jgi:hypothetical protein
MSRPALGRHVVQQCITRRELMMLGVAAAGSSAGAFKSDAGFGMVTPEMFGATGDGRTNDTDAFAAMSKHINQRSGGIIELRPVTYVVGRQRPGAGGMQPSFVSSEIIHLTGCTDPVVIRGNGATLRCAPGLRFGRFDPHSGAPLPDPKALDLTNRAPPYIGMVWIEHCSGGIEISDLELDGNLKHLVVGGRGFPAGWEAGGVGLRMYGNRGPERLTRIHAHHHAVDGMMLAPAVDRKDSTSVTDAICDYNGRQGCSVTGGRNFRFERCRFTRTGRAGLGASPGAGLDVEAEDWPIRDLTFSNCEFSDNRGFGLVAGTGDSERMRFEDCKFVGTTNWSAWPDRPGMRFARCLFVGSINHAYGDADPARSARFSECTFTDDPAHSPTGAVYLPDAGEWIAIVTTGPNVHFDHCRFRLVRKGVLPLSGRTTIYSDCTMSQRSAAPSGPEGTFVGTNSIAGNAYLGNSIIRGKLILNGRVLPRTRAKGSPKPS